MATNEWVLQQLAGERKKVVLSGYAAPFGRPRQKPLLKDKLQVREQIVRYPDSIMAPTRHIFGTHREDLEFSGRWMDKFLGTGQTKKLVDSVEELVNDKIQVRVSWGDIISYVGLIESIEAAWESPDQVAWSIRFSVDNKDGDEDLRNNTVLDLAAPVKEIELRLHDTLASLHLVNNEISHDLFDFLDSLISTVSSVTRSFVSIANQFQSLESATIDELQRFRGAIHQTKTAILTFQNALGAVAIDGALFVRQADQDIIWTAEGRAVDVNNIVMLSILADLERDAEIAEIGRTNTSYTARTGDTWESVSNQFYGTPSGADTLRQANGIKLGALPQPGVKYRIPLK